MILLKNNEDIVKVIDKIFCNYCGNEIVKDIYGYSNDYLHIEKIWGYNSDSDGEKHNFDLCEKCYKDLIKNFKIPVK